MDRWVPWVSTPAEEKTSSTVTFTKSIRTKKVNTSSGLKQYPVYIYIYIEFEHIYIVWEHEQLFERLLSYFDQECERLTRQTFFPWHFFASGCLVPADLEEEELPENEVPCHLSNFRVHPRKLTWNLKIHPWKRRNIYKPPIFGFHVGFRGCKNFQKKAFSSGIPRLGKDHEMIH